MNDPTNGQKRAAGAPIASSPFRPSAGGSEAVGHEAGPARPAHEAGSRPQPLKPPAHRPSDDSEPEELNESQLRELRGILEQRRAELVASIDGRRGEERDNGREVGDEMDEANTEGASAMASKLLERDVHLLREIDRALAKMGEGTYGACEGTGEPIGYSRLKLRPWARFSVEYQEELERAQRSRGGT
jgi:DnaK suppressor protein